MTSNTVHPQTAVLVMHAQTPHRHTSLHFHLTLTLAIQPSTESRSHHGLALTSTDLITDDGDEGAATADASVSPATVDAVAAFVTSTRRTVNPLFAALPLPPPPAAEVGPFPLLPRVVEGLGARPRLPYAAAEGRSIGVHPTTAPLPLSTTT